MSTIPASAMNIKPEQQCIHGNGICHLAKLIDGDYCFWHSCPFCSADKSSQSPSCESAECFKKHEQCSEGTLAPPEPKDSEHKCQLAERPCHLRRECDSMYCYFHTCPWCRDLKSSKAPSCKQEECEQRLKNLSEAPPSSVPVAEDEASRCQHADGKVCNVKKVDKSEFCVFHRCPSCGADKSSQAPTCGQESCAASGQPPASSAPAEAESEEEKCHHGGTVSGICNLKKVQGANFCQFHACPGCKEDKSSRAPLCANCWSSGGPSMEQAGERA